MSIDDMDLKLLDLVQKDARWSHARLGKEVGLSTSAVNARLTRLRETGIIEGISARLAPGQVGLDLLAFVEVLVERPEQEPGFLSAATALDEVLECHHVTGEFSYLLKVIAPDAAALEDLLRSLKSQPGVVRSRTSIALSSPKWTTRLPLKRAARREKP